MITVPLNVQDRPSRHAVHREEEPTKGKYRRVQGMGRPMAGAANGPGPWSQFRVRPLAPGAG